MPITRSCSLCDVIIMIFLLVRCSTSVGQAWVRSVARVYTFNRSKAVTFPDSTRALAEKGLVKFPQKYLNSEEFPRVGLDGVPNAEIVISVYE